MRNVQGIGHCQQVVQKMGTILIKEIESTNQTTRAAHLLRLGK